MTAPDPVTPAYLRSLIEGAGISQGQAAQMLRVDPRTLRRWLAGDRACPWMAAELLRRMVNEPGPDEIDDEEAFIREVEAVS